MSETKTKSVSKKTPEKKESGWTAKFHKLHPEAKTIKQISKAVKIPEKALKEVIKKGRGAYHNDVSTWLSVCRTCHNWIELNPIEDLFLDLKKTKETRW